jgi:hypothetical protein
MLMAKVRDQMKAGFQSCVFFVEYCCHFLRLLIVDECDMNVEYWWNDTGWGEPKYSRKTCPTTASFTTNFTWTSMRSNLDVCGEGPAVNPMSRDTI